MTFPPDLADDCLLVDGTETITLQGSATVTVAGAKRGLLSEREARLLHPLRLEPDDLGWNLPESSLGAVTPRLGDTLVDQAEVAWTIISALRCPMIELWRVVGRLQR